jgi:hypothetical protein
MTNKYSEGYPGARYYGGNEFIDQAERLCQVWQAEGWVHEHTRAVHVPPLQPGGFSLPVSVQHVQQRHGWSAWCVG